MASSSGKVYGLITHQSKKKTPVLLPKLSAFGDSSDEESAHSAVNQSLQYEAKKQRVKKQTQLEIQRALEEDPTVYEYDSIYDSMEEKKQQKVLAKKAAKDSKEQTPRGKRASWTHDKIELLLKILLASHPKYIKAKFNFRVMDFYAEIGQMLSYSGLMVENLLKNLGREYRDILRQVELEEAVGNTPRPRLRGSETVFSLFGEFTRLYCLLPDRRPPNIPQDIASSSSTTKGDGIDNEFKYDSSAIDMYQSGEMATATHSRVPFPMEIHQQSYQDHQDQQPELPDFTTNNIYQQPTQTDFTTNSMRLNPTPVLPVELSENSFEPARTKSKVDSSKTNVGTRARGRQRFRFAPRSARGSSSRTTWGSVTIGKKRRIPTQERNYSSSKKRCPCEDKTAKFQEQMLHVLSGIGQELQLLRQGFFALYDIKENTNSNTESPEYDENSAEDDYNEEDCDMNEDRDDECPNPSVIFPNLGE
ncbi:uncharacterized protein [Asterias amurensis]|uniref:uncharacterized protein isoform X1 n=1 Tax=Asterias amurensis TaxID=7602 RepID=UPI003AB4DC4A